MALVASTIIGIAGVTLAAGATGYGIVKSQHAAKTANDQANHATKQQAINQQIATAQGEAQAQIAAADKSRKNWEYIAIGGLVLVVVGGVIYAVTRKK